MYALCEDTVVSVTKIIAEVKDGEIHQSADWEWMDLSTLGVVYGVYFTMESTDMHPIVELGPNIAVYFCMDILHVAEVVPNEQPDRPTGLAPTSTEFTITCYWNALQS